MKKVDYYAMNQPWKMPKWLGFTIGGIFGAIAIGSGILIVSLTRPAPAAIVAAQPAVEAPATPVATAQPAQAQPEAAAAADVAAPEAKVAHRGSRHHDKHASKAGRSLHGAKMASAKRPAGLSDGKAQAILAKHDDKSKRKDKDALDKLLGL